MRIALRNTVGFILLFVVSGAYAAEGNEISFEKLRGLAPASRNQSPAQPKQIKPVSKLGESLTEAEVKREVERFLDSELTDFYKKNPPKPAKLGYEFSPVQIEKITLTNKATGRFTYFYVVDTTVIVYDETGGRHVQLAKVPSGGNILLFSYKPTGEWEYGEDTHDNVNKTLATRLDAIRVERSLLLSGVQNQDGYTEKQTPTENNQTSMDQGKLFFRSQYMYGPYGGYMEYRWYAFGRDNVVYRGSVETDGSQIGFFARTAPDIFDVAGACQANPKNCGKLSGGNINWADGSSQTSVEQKDNWLHIGGLIAKPLRPFARGQRFDGNFTVLSVLTTSAVSASSSKTLRFNLDGTFSTKSVDVASVHPYQGDGINAGTSYGKSAGEGTYEVVGGTLILNYQGRQEKLPILDYGVNKDKTPMGKPEALIIGDCYYKRYE